MKSNLILRTLGRLILLCAVISASFNLYASDGNGPQKGLTAGIGLGISNSHHTDIGIILRPNIGYRIDRNTEVGLFLKYEHTHGDYYGIYGYGEYNFFPFRNNCFSLFVDLQGGMNWLTGLDYDVEAGVEPKIHFAEVGFVPGLRYHFPNSRVDLRLRYLFVGFNNYDRGYKEAGGCLGRGDLILDAGLRRLEFGISVGF